MMTVKKYFVILLIFLSLAWIAYLLYPSYIEFKKTQKELAELEIDLLKQQKRNEAIFKINHKLKTDPRMIERVAREKFGWSKAGEKIYDFSNIKMQDHMSN